MGRLTNKSVSIGKSSSIGGRLKSGANSTKNALKSIEFTKVSKEEFNRNRVSVYTPLIP